MLYTFSELKQLSNKFTGNKLKKLTAVGLLGTPIEITWK